MTQDMDPAEVTFFQQLDLRKQEQAHELELAKVNSAAKVKIERQRTIQKFFQMISENSVIPWLGWIGFLLVASTIISFSVWGIHHLATSGPPKTIEQVTIEKKQDRWSDCVYNNGEDDGAHDNIWYPTAEGGNGLCLPKDKEPPK